MTELRGDLVVLRPLSEDDVDRIVTLGADSEVARWWPGLTPEHVREKARGEDEGAVVFAIVAGGAVAGMIQYYEEAGFKQVGVMREYWLDPDGVWRDGVLLDMLPSDLRDPG